MKHSFSIVFILLCPFIILYPGYSSGSEPVDVQFTKTLEADFRHRPPEMVIDEGRRTGPLKDILEIAAQKIGYTIKWKNSPFARSLKNLEHGRTDILPRLIMTRERRKFAHFLTPIGSQQKNIHFLVKKGKESLISQYEDLIGLSIAVKRKASYFKRFNQDKALNKTISEDDGNMVLMFDKGRFDTMAVLDKKSVEYALKKYNISNYAFADYEFIQTIDNHFGMSKLSPNAHVYKMLNSVFEAMTISGKIGEIYRKYDLEMPTQFPRIEQQIAR